MSFTYPNLDMLRINEMFQSIEGEISPFLQGKITTFIRVAGCNLQCSWCDTTYAGKPLLTDRILVNEQAIEKFYHTQVKKFNSEKITITGGEPLLQEKGVMYLVNILLKNGLYVTIETNGSIRPKPYLFHPRFGYVVDFKLKSSGMMHKMCEDFHRSLGPNDIVKFVIADYTDYKLARTINKGLKTRAIVAFSPVLNTLYPRLLMEWMIRDKVTAPIISLQLHKLIKVK